MQETPPSAASQDPPRRKRSGRPRALTHAAILDAAEVMVRANGSGSLTMRSLGLRLGVQAPTLYTYFQNLDDVENAVVERIVRGIPLPSRERPEPLAEQVVETFLALCDLQRHSPRCLEAAPGSMTWKWNVRVSNRLVETYRAMGASRERAVLVQRTLSGIALQSASDASFNAPPEVIAARRRLIAAMPAAEAGELQRLHADPPLVLEPNEAGLREILRQMIALLLPGAGRSA